MAGAIGSPRKSGTPNPATVRKIGILLDLIRNRSISLSACAHTYGSSERTLLRDLQELRNIGQTSGFRISDREYGDVVELSEFKARPAGLLAGEKRLRNLIAQLFKAFGEPVDDVVEGVRSRSTDASDASFLRIVQPQLMDGTAVAKTFRALEGAWQSDARVEFRYKGQRRTVEPAAAVVRGGRYYLIARDCSKGKSGWRQFAMDLIEAPIRRAGTFRRTAPPSKYLSTDTIGFFKGDGEPQTVEVTFSKELAAAATSRKWQRAQRVQRRENGTVTITLTVDDPDEVIRWTLSYGGEAWITAPPRAVARARELLERAQQHYK